MAEPEITAPSPAQDRAQGVVHVRARHTDRFTVVGNHLAQHRELTLTAIGLAVHIQSLPDGARVDIKTLATGPAPYDTRAMRPRRFRSREARRRWTYRRNKPPRPYSPYRSRSHPHRR